MINVSILGATGYTGLELTKILARHKFVNISSITSDSSSGREYSAVYPQMRGVCDLVLDDMNLDEIARKSDAAFLCLPHGASMDAAAYLYEKGLKVFDLSADYRIKDEHIYNEAYKTEHRYPNLLDKAAYGLAELNEEGIKISSIIAVPGCYPTSILIPLVPLLKAGLIDEAAIISDSKSGVSGAGKKATDNTHYCNVNESIKPYGIFTHRHKPEIDHIFKQLAGKEIDIVFTPHLAPFTRGMLSTIYVQSSFSEDELYKAWEDSYKNSKIVRIRKDVPAVLDVANTPFIDIALFKKGKNVIITSVIDNLLKGASSQAVQCFNIKFGFNHTDGLI